jgi:hypothetical protein
MTIQDQQMKTVQMFAQYVHKTNSDASGVAYMFFECGCVQGAPFDAGGDQVGPITHLGQTIRGEIRVCGECVKDGGAPERVTKSALIFFNPSALTEEERERISDRIFVDSPPADRDKPV